MGKSVFVERGNYKAIHSFAGSNANENRNVGCCRSFSFAPKSIISDKRMTLEHHVFFEGSTNDEKQTIHRSR